MTYALCALGLTAVLAADPAKPGVVPLCAEEPWYKAARGEERIYDGILELNSGSGRIGPGRFNAYRLAFTGTDGKPQTRELYLPGKAHLLAGYRGQRVRLVARAVDTEADGKTYHELWAARLEIVGLGTSEVRDASGIHARCNWQPDAARRLGMQRLVIRSGEELARHMGLSGRSAETTAAGQMAQRLRVNAIDWNKSMLICVTAGLQANGADRLTITRLEASNTGLTVYYRLPPPAAGAQGLSYPAETVLVDRVAGEVRVVAEKPTP